MKRLKRLERNGWEVTSFAFGYRAIKGKNFLTRRVTANSITGLHKKIFGY